MDLGKGREQDAEALQARCKTPGTLSLVPAYFSNVMHLAVTEIIKLAPPSMAMLDFNATINLTMSYDGRS